MPAPTLRIAHCSDIHLDADDHAPQIYRTAFMRTLQAMARSQPDLLLLAGDLFDANDASTDTIHWAMQVLGDQPCPVVMIPGNHDCLLDNAIYRRHDFNAIDNVTLLMDPAGETRIIESLSVAVWGKGMLDHSPAHRPLQGCPTRPSGVRWYLGMGHGIYVPEGADTDRSSPVHEHEIGDSGCDYVALGHHHAALQVEARGTTGAWCGSPTDLVGGAATWALVELSDPAPGRTAAADVQIQVLDPEH
ncbi:MAG: metallophosphoesterase [Gammaproteobacteria bacterium]|nr:metallophosphoesterase [Gammaproteobacteria bacterium]